MESGYDWWAPPTGRPTCRRLASILVKLRSDHPELVVCHGWASPVARLGILYARLTRTPLLYYGDTNYLGDALGAHPFLRRVILRRMFRSSAGAISTGTFNELFYLSHGMPSGRIHSGVLPADVDRFFTVSQRSRSRLPAHARCGPVIGFAGKFVMIKGIADLIEAAAMFPQDRPWQLWLIGDGPLRADLESLVTRCGLDDRVRFLGFRNTDELPDLLSAVDIMVLPSHREARGLIAVESMAAGAATIVSTATGLWGAGDIAEHGRSALVFPAGDVEALARSVRRLMDDERLRIRMAAEGQQRAIRFGMTQFADSLAAAVLHTALRRSRVDRH